MSKRFYTRMKAYKEKFLPILAKLEGIELEIESSLNTNEIVHEDNACDVVNEVSSVDEHSTERQTQELAKTPDFGFSEFENNLIPLEIGFNPDNIQDVQESKPDGVGIDSIYRVGSKLYTQKFKKNCYTKNEKRQRFKLTLTKDETAGLK